MDVFPCVISPLHELPQTSLLGEVFVPGPNKHFRRTPAEWILYIVTEGTMIICEEEQEYRLTAGDVLLLAPGKCHCGVLVQDAVRYYYLHFHWDKLRELSLTHREYLDRGREIQEAVVSHIGEDSPRDYLLLPRFFHPTPDAFQNLTADFRILQRDFDKVLPHQDARNNCALFSLLLNLSRSELLRTPPSAGHTLSPTLPIMAYIREHCRERVTSRQLEEHFHHNFDYMNRKFKETMGMTIFQFLEKYRIEESKKLLESNRFSVAEIAESLGFCNAYYFSRVFKKQENMTPTQYRKSCQ